MRAHIWAAGNLGCFTGVLLDAPSGRASLSCNITGGYRVDGATGEATQLIVYSGDNFEITNPGAIWPSYSTNSALAEYGQDIYYPATSTTDVIELEGRVFLGFFQCGNKRGNWYKRIIGFSNLYLDYQ